MKRSVLAAGRGIGIGLMLAASGAAHADISVVGAVGVRSLSGDIWDSNVLDSDSQFTLGVLADFGVGDLPLYIATGLQVSADDGGEGGYDSAIVDVSVGLKLMPTEGAIRPYVGAGIASVAAAVDSGVFTDDDDQSFGYYVGAGALFRINGNFTLGLDLRYIGGTEIELRNIQDDADSVTATLLIGYSWGD